ADPSLSAEHIVSMQKALEIWNTSFRAEFDGKDIFVYGGQLTVPRAFVQDGFSVISVTSQWEGKPTAQAETSLMWTGDKATEADIRLNGDLDLSTDDNVKANEVDTVALIVHELGHVLGLGHRDSTEYTAMAPKLALGNKYRRSVGEM